VRSRRVLFAIAATLISGAVSASEYPFMDLVAQKVIQKYQQATCEALWAERSAPKSPDEQEVVEMLRKDPAMRTAFIDEVAAPVVNKMFECGMVP